MPTLSEKLLASGVIQLENYHPRAKIPKLVYARGVPETGELARIRAMPRRPAVFTDETVPDLSPLYVIPNADCPGCRLCKYGPVRLRPEQSASLWEGYERNGLLSMATVGSGKTLVGLLLPDAMNSERTVFLVKPSLKAQLVAEMPMYSFHFKIPIEKINIVTYVELSDANTRGILHDIKPDLIICDEAHRISRSSSSRTKRLKWYLKEFPATRMVAMSGTITNRRLTEFAWLAEACLRSGSPLPDSRKGDLRDWGDALDAFDNPEHPPLAPGALLTLCTEEERAAVEAGTLAPRTAARAGFMRRLTETTGVISTGDDDIKASLEIRARRPAVPEVVQKALAELERLWSWDDEDFDSALMKARVERQLSMGFWYKWRWPVVEGVAEKDEVWLEARRNWHREVREFMTHRAKPGIDSPLLIANAAERGDWKSEFWGAWAAVKDREEPPVEAVWISDFIIQDVREWLNFLPTDGKNAGHRGLIWYSHSSLGERVARDLELPLFGPDSGQELNEMLQSSAPARAIVLSIEAHKEGVNAQGAYAHNLILNHPAQGGSTQQLYGRTHRKGQLADEVTVHVLQHTQILEKSFKQALVDAEYIFQSTGQPQKLLYAAKVGMPEQDR